jgi:pantoate kinase
MNNQNSYIWIRNMRKTNEVNGMARLENEAKGEKTGIRYLKEILQEPRSETFVHVKKTVKGDRL